MPDTQVAEDLLYEVRDGIAREDLVTRRGHVRLTVRPTGGGASVWQVEDVGDRGGGTGRAADALSLPLLTTGPSGTILYMNTSVNPRTHSQEIRDALAKISAQ